MVKANNSSVSKWQCRCCKKVLWHIRVSALKMCYADAIIVCVVVNLSSLFRVQRNCLNVPTCLSLQQKWRRAYLATQSRFCLMAVQRSRCRRSIMSSTAGVVPPPYEQSITDPRNITMRSWSGMFLREGETAEHVINFKNLLRLSLPFML